MQLASAWLLIGTIRGSNTPLRGVTPAELMLLVRDRTAFAGGCPVHNLEIVGVSKRSDDLERRRLRAKYGKGLHNEEGKVINKDQYKIDTLYPGEGTSLPQSFSSLPAETVAQCKANKLVEPAPDIPDWDESELAKLDKELAELDKEQVEPVPAAEAQP